MAQLKKNLKLWSVGLLLAAVSSSKAFSITWDTYDCESIPGDEGAITPERLTVEARGNEDAEITNATVSFPGYSIHDYDQASFDKKNDKRRNKAIKSAAGAQFFPVGSHDGFFLDIDNSPRVYAVVKLFAGVGFLRRDQSTYIIVYFKKTEPEKPHTNLYQWGRTYGCEKRADEGQGQTSP